MPHRLLFILFFCSTLIWAQRGRRNAEPVLHEVSNKAVVQCVFPEAVKVEKANEFWYHILNKDNKVVGYAMNSQHTCSDIKGYKGITPVMIITDKKGRIQKVALLTHYETLGYVRLLEDAGFFSQWNNKNIKEAGKHTLDGYSGATETALAIEKHVQFLLKNGEKLFPGKNKL